MTIETKMSELLKGVVQDAALTTEMLDNIKQLIADNELMTDSLASLRSAETGNKKTISDKNDRIQMLVAQNDVFMERESQLQKRELKADLLDMAAAHQTQRVEDHKEMVGLIFRNVRHMESISSNKNIAIDGGRDVCGYSTMVADSEIKETEDK